jgi:hypothetical protein
VLAELNLIVEVGRDFEAVGQGLSDLRWSETTFVMS